MLKRYYFLNILLQSGCEQAPKKALRELFEGSKRQCEALIFSDFNTVIDSTEFFFLQN